MPGAPLIVGDESVAKTWQVISDDPDYKYDHLVQSWYPPLTSVSFDRFRLADASMSFVIQFPSNNVQPGAPAQLGMMLPQASNQDWTLTKPRESFSQ